MRLDRVDGVVLPNSKDEQEAVKAAVEAAASQGHLRSWANLKVSGTVTMDGTPLAGVDVRFYFGEQFITGTTNEQGHYAVYAKRRKSDFGTCRVRIYWPKDSQETITIPEKYGRASMLEATIEAGENTFDFALTSE